MQLSTIALALTRLGGRNNSPSRLFNAGEQGVWYDPSDRATLFQDASGTTPVTAIEQPVGLILDKSGRGNHAYQSTSASRPVLSALVNLLTYTEQFDNAAWTKALVGITKDATTAPDGAVSADLYIPSSDSGFHEIYQNFTSVSGVSYTGSFVVKAAGYRYVQLLGPGAVFAEYANFDLQTGTRTAGTTGFGSISAIGNGWYRITLTATALSSSATARISLSVISSGTAARVATMSGDGTSGIYIWGADLRVANDGVGLPAYQRVNTATDYDTAGFPQREYFDGVDDAYTIAAGGGGTTAFFFCACINVAAVGVEQTIISDTGTNTGYRVRINASNRLEISAGNGTAYTTANTTATVSIGQAHVITCWHDGTNLNAQINNGTVAQQAFAAATAGTASITVGKDNGAATRYFKGSIFACVYVKDDVQTVAQIASAKKYCARKGLLAL